MKQSFGKPDDMMQRYLRGGLRYHMNLFLSMSLCGTLVFSAAFLVEKLGKDRLTGKTKYTLYKLALLFYLLPVQWFKFLYKRVLVKLFDIPLTDLPLEFETFHGMLYIPLGNSTYLRMYFWEVILLLAPVLLCILFLIYHIGKYRKVRRIFQGSSCKLEYGENDGRKSIPCYTSSDVSSPFSIGVVHPKIFFPDTPLSEDQMRFAYQHESHHIRKGDILYKFISLVAVALHLYNPCVYLLYKKLQIFCEYACDEQIIQGLSEEKRKTYQILIIQMSVKDHSLSSELFASLSGNQKIIKRRIENMENKKRNNKAKAVAGLFMVCAVFASTALTTYAYHPMNERTVGYSSKQMAELCLDLEKNESGTEKEVYESHSGEGISLKESVDRYADLPFDASDALCIYEDGTIEPITASDPDAETYSTCAHAYVTVSYMTHTKNSSGGCTVKEYLADKCRYCQTIKNQTLISSATFVTCPH